MASPTHAVTDSSLVRFARRLSHDLNNYATVVRTYSELVLTDLPADSPTRGDIEEMQRAAEGMVAYLQRVTRFARAGLMRKTAQPVDELLADAVATFAEQVPSRPLVPPGHTGAMIATDGQWFREAVTELLHNAHAAAPAGTPIRVTSEASDEGVRVAVHDQGPGVPPDLVYLFEPFATSQPAVRGAGQGLALVKAFAMASGGDVTLERADRDTVATLHLPRLATAPHP